MTGSTIGARLRAFRSRAARILATAFFGSLAFAAPPAFAQSFIRTDSERPDTRVYVTLWDARQVELHVVPGSQEPMGATGETGSGSVPRDPRTMSRLVAGFNGGFQALQWALSTLLLGFIVPVINNWAHIGGFIGGYLVSTALNPLTRAKGDHMLIAAVSLVVSIGAVVYSIVDNWMLIVR